MQQLTPQQVKTYMEQAEELPILLDVREPAEVEICAIEGATNIPLAQIPSSLDNLDPEREYVLICHHGMRSQHAGLFLKEQGFERLINLVGGIDAWANQVEPTMARY